MKASQIDRRQGLPDVNEEEDLVFGCENGRSPDRDDGRGGRRDGQAKLDAPLQLLVEGARHELNLHKLDEIAQDPVRSVEDATKGVNCHRFEGYGHDADFKEPLQHLLGTLTLTFVSE